MSDVEAIAKANRDLAEKINDEALADPTSKYFGKFVGLANGQVVVVEDDLDKMARRLIEIEPDPARTFGIEIGIDYSKPQYIWASCDA